MNNKIISLIIFLMLLPLSCMKEEATAWNGPYSSNVTSDVTSSSPKDAIATVRVEEGKVVLVLSDKNRVFPLNWDLAIPKEPYRAMVEYVKVSVENDPNKNYVHLLWLEPIQTGNIILDTVTPSSAKAADPVGIVKDEFTSLEDRFLTIHYKINTSGTIPHSFSLTPGEEKNEIVLLHDAHGDAPTYLEEGLIAFPLDQILPVSGRAKLSVSYRDLDNKISTLQFEYNL